MPENEGNAEFVVKVPMSTLEDLALNISGVDGLEGFDDTKLAALLQGVIEAGMEEWLGEVDHIHVRKA